MKPSTRLIIEIFRKIRKNCQLKKGGDRQRYFARERKAYRQYLAYWRAKPELVEQESGI